MGLEIVYGVAGEDGAPTGEGTLHVVRTAHRRKDLEERLVWPAGGAFGPRVLTLEDLVERLHDVRTTPRGCIGEVARRTLIRALAARIDGFPPVLVDAAARLQTLLKQYGIYRPEAALERFPSLARTAFGAPFLELFRRYQGVLEALGLYDADGLFIEAAREIASGAIRVDRAVPGVRRLVVEGLADLNPVQIDLLRRLAEVFESVSLCLDLPSAQDAARRPWRIFARDVARLPDLPGVCVAAERRALAGSAIRTILAEDRESEVLLIGERIGSILRDDPAARVAVAFPVVERYAPLVAEVFPRLGIPWHAAGGVPLISTGVGAATRDLLRVVLGRFARDDVVTCLRSPFISADPGGVAGRRDRQAGIAADQAAEVERIAIEAGVLGGRRRGGRRDWDLGLERHARSLRKAAAGSAADPEAAEAVRRDRRRADRVEAVRDRVLAVLQRFPDPDTTATFSVHADRVLDLLGEFGVFESAALLGSRPDDRLRRAFRAATSAVSSVLRILEELRSAALLVAAGGAAPAEAAPAATTFDAFAREVLEALALTIVPTAPAVRDGVAVTGLLDIRHVGVDHLFLGGLVEGEFPAAAEPCPFLSPEDAGEIGAQTAARRRHEAAWLLDHARRMAARELVLSRPLRSVSGDATTLLLSGVASRFLEDHGVAEPAAAESPPLPPADILGGRLGASADPDVVAEARRDLAAAGVAGRGLLRRVLAEASRRDPGRLGPFDGLLSGAATAAVAEILDPASRIVSASQLDDYASCPMRFLFRRILRLEAREAADADVPADLRGRIVHRVLLRLHTEDGGIGRPAAAGDPAWEAQVAERFRRLVADEVASLWRDDRYVEALARSLGALAPRVARTEAKLALSLRPHLFEAAFGPEGGGRDLLAGPVELVVPLGDGTTATLRLQGAVDRVDREIDGAGFVVFDYKSGDLSQSVRALRAGRAFQLPLYVLAMADILPRVEKTAAAPLGAAFYGVKVRGDVQVKPCLIEAEVAKRLGVRRGSGIPRDALAAVLDASRARAGAVIAAGRRGLFHGTGVAEGDRPCASCDYRRICRAAEDAERVGGIAARGGAFPCVVDLLDEAGDPGEDDA